MASTHARGNGRKAASPRNPSAKVQAIRAAAAAARESQGCARCLKAAPAQDSPGFADWEALGDGQQVICPDCVTPAEQQAMDEDAMAMAEKVRENRLRRMAERQGLRLEKSRRRDPRAYDYGTYQLVNAWDNTLEAYGGPQGYGLTLDEIEAALTTPVQAGNAQQRSGLRSGQIVGPLRHTPNCDIRRRPS
jgi:hypothetical protein